MRTTTTMRAAPRADARARATDTRAPQTSALPPLAGKCPSTVTTNRHRRAAAIGSSDAVATRLTPTGTMTPACEATTARASRAQASSTRCFVRRRPAATTERLCMPRGVAARLRWPVLVEAASSLRYGPPLPGLVDGADTLLRTPDFSDQSEPDLVLRLGQVPTSKPVRTSSPTAKTNQIWLTSRAFWATRLRERGSR